LVPDIGSEYRIITTGAGWVDKSARGRLRFDGRDAVPFLQALVSNDVDALAPGQGVYATYLTPQGRMITDLRIYRRDGHLVVNVPDGRAAQLAAAFDMLIFAEDVAVTDVTGSTTQIGVLGARAAEVVGRALGLDAGALGALAPLATLGSDEQFVVRADDVDVPSFDVIAPATNRAAIVERLTDAGAAPVSPELVEALRIDAGRPLFGVDMNEDTIPLEAGLLDRAISTTKGCYVGQEIIIRVLHRGGGRVAKRLVRVELDPSITLPPSPGSPLIESGSETGVVTSAAISPSTGRVVALGYVRRARS
jgi:folate-binding protein YgfZ